MVSVPLVVTLFAASLGSMREPPGEFREAGPLPSPSALPAPELRVLILGDYGDPTPQQRRVTAALLRWNARHPFDLVFQPGDNLYNCGPGPRVPGPPPCDYAPDGVTVDPGFVPPHDPIFEQNEAPLRALRGRGGQPPPIYLALGNHDIGEPRYCKARGMTRDEWMRRRSCLEVAHRSPTWRMPGRRYVVDEGPARFIVVDSNVTVAGYGGFTLADEADFVREASAGCDARLCFLVAHHPPAGQPPPGGAPSPGGTNRLVDAAGGRLAAVIAGHLHSLVHSSYGDIDVMITGAGARRGSADFLGWPAGSRVRFGSNDPGFGVLEVWRVGWSYRMVDDRDRSLHCCAATGRGPCVPFACAEAR